MVFKTVSRRGIISVENEKVRKKPFVKAAFRTFFFIPTKRGSTRTDGKRSALQIGRDGMRKKDDKMVKKVDKMIKMRYNYFCTIGRQ